MDEWLPGGQESDPEMFPQGEDSGIDSDSERLTLLNMPHVGEQSDSSCEETGHHFDNRFGKQKFDALLSGSSDEYSPRHCSTQATYTKRPKKPDLDEERSEPGRDSPPLLEVELTASDEDDDGSVLELVIPMHQNTWYHGVKPELRYEESFWRIMCCVPKLK